jgi:hypothetical protein
MDHDSELPVWPGFVAAVSCLVLGLLLTTAIILSLHSQLGVLAAQYAAALMNVPPAPPRPERSDAATLAKTLPPSTIADSFPPVVPPAVVRQGGASGSGQAPGVIDRLPREEFPEVAPQDNHLTLIFGDRLTDIPPDRRSEIELALESLSVTPESRWRIRASAPATDVTRRRNTFRLMVAMRSFLVTRGIDESRIELRLEEGSNAVDGGADITVRIGPFEPGNDGLVPLPAPAS